jgi:hypothetical protein
MYVNAAEAALAIAVQPEDPAAGEQLAAQADALEVLPMSSEAPDPAQANRSLEPPEGYLHTHKDGHVAYAKNAADIGGVCIGMRGRSDKEIIALMKLTALGQKKIAEDGTKLTAKRVKEPPKQTPLIREKSNSPKPVAVMRKSEQLPSVQPIERTVLLAEAVSAASAKPFVKPEKPLVDAKASVLEELPKAMPLEPMCAPDISERLSPEVATPVIIAPEIEPLPLVLQVNEITPEQVPTPVPMPFIKTELPPRHVVTKPADRSTEAPVVQSVKRVVSDQKVITELAIEIPAVSIEPVPYAEFEAAETEPVAESLFVSTAELTVLAGNYSLEASSEPLSTPMDAEIYERPAVKQALASTPSIPVLERTAEQALPPVVILPFTLRSLETVPLASHAMEIPAAAAEVFADVLQLPPIIIAITESIAAAPPETELLTEPIMAAITTAVQEVQTQIVRQGSAPESIEILAIKLEPLVIALCETSGVAYTKEDVKSFVKYLVRVNIQPLIKAAAAVNLEQQGTHEAKHRFSLIYGQADAGDEPPRRLRGIVALLQWSARNTAA